MRRLAWIITIPVTVIVVAFSLANRQMVTIDLWPFERTMDLPLFFVVLVALLVGFLIGGLIMWISDGKTRSRARAAFYQAQSLEREIAYLKRKQARASAPPATPPVPANQPIARAGR